MLTELISNFNEWLSHLSTLYPAGVYAVIFCIVFVETAFFPAAPFLPGDGLLFLTGILAASGSISFWIAAIILIMGGVFGNMAAYNIGIWIAPREVQKIRWLKLEHYLKAQKFYEKYGANALFYSRFIPIVRSIVPLVAGIAVMDYKTFAKYSVVSVALWVLVIMSAAYFLGHITWIKQHFTIMILIFTMVSTLPLFIMWVKIKLIQLINKH